MRRKRPGQGDWQPSEEAEPITVSPLRPTPDRTLPRAPVGPPDGPPCQVRVYKNTNASGGDAPAPGWTRRSHPPSTQAEPRRNLPLRQGRLTASLRDCFATLDRGEEPVLPKGWVDGDGMETALRSLALSGM